MKELGDGIAIAACCVMLIVLTPYGWVGLLVIAAIFGAFK